jgi:hypothetical protein
MYPGKLTHTTSNTASKTSNTKWGKFGCDACGGGFFFSAPSITCDVAARLLRSNGNLWRKFAFWKDVGFVKKGMMEIDTVDVGVMFKGLDRIAVQVFSS